MDLKRKIRVLIVDDSSYVRQMFTEILSEDSEIEVVGSAADPLIAREKIKLLHPDVITLDIEMPKMDGLSFLEKIMTLRPMPVVMVSSLTQEGARESIEALEMGAIDVVGKPQASNLDGLKDLAEELVAKVKIAARAKIKPKSKLLAQRLKPKLQFDPRNTLIAIGASTGGVEAVRDVLVALPGAMPPILVTQHMPKHFTKSFATRLDTLTEMTVVEAEDGQEIRPGCAYIAPGDRHLELSLSRAGHGYLCRVKDEHLVSGHCPSVDVLFNSVAENAGRRAIGVILTGMGRDGAKGLLAMKQKGALTLGQDEASSVVYGMPKAAYQMGAVDVQLSLESIPEEILKLCEIHSTA